MPKITETFLKGLKKLDSENIYSDSEVRGFAVKLRPSGNHTYIYRYRFRRKQHTYTIGKTKDFTSAQARRIARDLSGQVARGINPLSNKQASDSTLLFAELASQYLKHNTKLSLRDDESKIRRILLPTWGNIHIDEIDSKKVRELLAKLSNKGLAPATINRYRSLISTIFNRAIEYGYLSKNPASSIKPSNENNMRDRWLNTDELQRLSKCLDDEPKNSANCIKMLLATGARCGDVFSMRWEELDIINKRWRIVSPKSQKSFSIPLNDLALQLLDEQRLFEHLKNVYVFPGKKLGSHIRTVRHTWNRVLAKANISDIRLHDLRHTFASHAVMSGVDLYTLSKLLGHHDQSMTARYAHLQDSALSNASSKVATSLAHDN